MAQPSHCPACATEFVAGVTRCSDCGGPLTPGDLPASAPSARKAASVSLPPAAEAAGLTELPDQPLCTVPGEQAETIARALTFEGITSLLVCDGLQRLRGPGQESTGPMANRRPVEIYVSAADLEEAEAIVASLEGGDLIGEQWLSEAEDEDDVASASPVIPKPAAVEPASEPELPAPTKPSSSGGVLLVIVVLLAVIAAFVAAL